MTGTDQAGDTPGARSTRGVGSVRPRLKWLAAAVATLLAALGTAGPAFAAGPPIVTGTGVSAVGTDAATLTGSVDPNGARTFARFAYVTQAEFEASGFTNAVRTPDFTIQATVKGSGDLVIGSNEVTGLETSSGTFAVGQEVKAPKAPGTIPAGTTIVKITTDPQSGEITELTLSKAATATGADVELTATGSQPIAAQISGLSPQTSYRFRIEAEHNAEAPVFGPERTFATLALSPTFEPCPNDPFRSGTFAPLTHPSSFLPDCRAYERASPLDKNGGDVQGGILQTKAAAQGGAVTFMSTFGVPGGQGAQSLPTYLASRGGAEWSTRGLLSPASSGEKAEVIGWSPDMSEIYTSATRLGDPRTAALLVQSDGGPPRQITPYAPDADYFYVGSSADNSVVVFESFAALPPAEGEEPIPAAREGARNLYAWDRESGSLSLVGVRNDGTSPAKGALGGPYQWTAGIDSQSLRLGGAFNGYYTQEERAVADDGSVFFTEVGSGQLYRRINPTAEQSDFVVNGDGEEECTEPAKACTIHVSASEKGNGNGTDGADPAGAQPAAFMAASADGAEAFFTSPEKLTDDANTGPEQPPAQIERDDLAGPPVEKPGFIPQRAIGVAVDSEHVYWADPQLGTIGRADLDGTNPQPAFIDPGETTCEYEVAEGVFETKEEASHPRYVAVDSEYVYWTNTGCSDEFGALGGTGTIGRADIGGTPLSINPEFIVGASNPQGIAVNATHIYWANAGRSAGVRAIGSAAIGGGEVTQSFAKVSFNGRAPSGVALSPTHVYYGFNEEQGNGDVGRVPIAGLPGGEESNDSLHVGNEGVQGITVDGSHVYWASRASGEEAIGRADLDFGNAEREFIPLDGKLAGLTVDSEHLYWANNGETPTNPGNDLYRWSAQADAEGHHLADLTVDPTGDGAEVQGVVGASADGEYVYFAANGLLADGAEPGDCEGQLAIETSGDCSLYLWHAGEISFVARLHVGPGLGASSDALAWGATPRSGNGGAGRGPKSSFLSADGRTLLFRSLAQLTGYDSNGTPELYRFRVGEGIDCVTCPPTGEAAAGGPALGRIRFPSINPSTTVASVSSRILSADGNRVFFETPEALVVADTNGAAGCPPFGEQLYPSCNDVYEWEAPGTGTCTQGGPGYSPLNGGCIYLISSGRAEEPSLLIDASASGDDVYFVTRDQLVGSDTDLITDVYDARVDGGLAAQNPQPPEICEAEGCKPAATPPPPYAAPPNFSGPGNPPPKHCKPAKKGKGKHKKPACGKKNNGKKHKPKRKKGSK